MNSTLVGTTRPTRFFAAYFDNALGLACMVASGSLLGEISPIDTPGRWQLVVGLAVMSVYFLYFFIFEWLFSATLGKLFTGLTVRQLDGTKCGAKAAFLRTITRPFEVNPIVIGCLPAAILIRLSSRRQRWGDWLANTVVIERSQII